MGQFKIGNLSLSSAYLGENGVNKIYLGTVLLYQKEEPIIENFRTDGVNTILMRYGQGGISKIPTEVDGVQITTIGSTAYNYSDVTEAIIPEGIIVIE